MDERFDAILRTFNDDQLEALLFVLRDMASGQMRILGDVNIELTDVELRELRGYVRALTDVSNQLVSVVTDAKKRVFDNSDDGDKANDLA